MTTEQDCTQNVCTIKGRGGWERQKCVTDEGDRQYLEDVTCYCVNEGLWEGEKRCVKQLCASENKVMCNGGRNHRKW